MSSKPSILMDLYCGANFSIDDDRLPNEAWVTIDRSWAVKIIELAELVDRLELSSLVTEVEMAIAFRTIKDGQEIFTEKHVNADIKRTSLSVSSRWFTFRGYIDNSGPIPLDDGNDISFWLDGEPVWHLADHYNLPFLYIRSP